MKRKERSRGLLMIAFGLGLFLAFCFPSGYLVVLLSIALIMCGTILWKN